jgi:hypothetical protein
LLLTIGAVARLENAGFMQKLRDGQNVVLDQRCCNTQGRYMAIEEFNGSGGGQEKMGLVQVCGGVTVPVVSGHTHKKGSPDCHFSSLLHCWRTQRLGNPKEAI